jgi:hypothetical protein
MSQREETDFKTWLEANGVGGDDLNFLYRALQDIELPEITLADYGPYAVIEEGDRTLIRGSRSTLVLPSLDARQALMQQIASLRRLYLEGGGSG